ncbi:MAG TPA: DUF2252 domain-containing protein [Candidatus Dormibacteraeota bacterium]
MTHSIEDRQAAGRALREMVPLIAHAEQGASSRDPIAFLETQADSRHDDLIAVRYGRMAASPFGFLRGAAAVMAFDLSSTPTTGIRVQACGDAHLRNYGKFATPERNVIFSINDFDETLPGPWEWDVKRLGASLNVVARERGFSAAKCQEAVVTTLRSYRERMAWYAAMRALDLWYDHTTIDDVIAHFPKKDVPRVQRDVRKATRKDHRRAVARYTTGDGGTVRFVDDPPLVIHFDDMGHDLEEVEHMLHDYRSTLPDDRRELLDRFRIVDVAHRVGGVGSVGTRCWICLMEASDHPKGDRIILQVKEAQASVLEPYAGASELGHHGRRVVAGQRLSQGATDIFLGWCEGPRTGRQYYVRQLWDLKGRSDLTTMNHRNLTYHGALCGWALARAHARTGDAVQISGYLGSGDAFERAVAAYSAAYARTTEEDHRALVRAIADGRVEARAGI